MTGTVDPVTSALTGHLSFYLLVAAIATWPIAVALLRLYTRAVHRSMRSSGRGRQPPAAAPPGGVAATGTATLSDLPGTVTSGDAAALLTRLMS